MKSGLTTPTKLLRDPTKAMNGPGYSSVVVVKEPWVNVVSSVQAFRRKQIFDGVIHTLKARICTEMKSISNIELKDSSLDVGIDVGIDIDLSVIAKCIYVVVNIYTNIIIAAANIICITVVTNFGLKDAHWEYSIRTKNKLENLAF